MAVALEGWYAASSSRRAGEPRSADDRLVKVEKAILGVRIAVVTSVAVLVAFGVPANVQAHPGLIWSLIGVTAVYALVVPMFPGPLLRRRAGSRLLNVADAALTLAIIAATGPAASPMVALLFLTIISTGMRFGLADALRAALVEGAIYALLVFAVPEPALPHDARVQAAVWWPVFILFAAVFTGALARIGEMEQAERLSAEARADREREARRQAQEAWRQREELLRVLVHEFRTPVASLGALARHLAGAGPAGTGEPGTRQALNLIQVHADHLDDMVAALGDVAKASPGLGDIDSQTRLTDVFLPELLGAAIAAAGGDQSTVRVKVEPEGAIARLDATRVRRIVTNLVENALRHTALGTTVDVETRLGTQRLEITVADHGTGLSRDDVDLAFRRYATFGERRGTSGLGLWIVDELTQRLGGTLEASPRPGAEEAMDGVGLLVRVSLPVVR